MIQIKQLPIPVNSKYQKQLILVAMSGVSLGMLLLISPWAGLVIAIGVLVVLVTLARPVYLCYLLVLGTVFASGMERGKIIPYLIPNEVILVLVTASAFPFILLRRRDTSNSRFIFVGLIILALGASIIPLMIYFARDVSLSVEELFSLVAPLQFVPFYLIFRYLPQDEKEVRAILRLMLVCAAVVGLVGLLQTMRVAPVLSLLSTWYHSSHEEAALNAGRISSFLSAWNSLGTFLMLNLLILRAVLVAVPKLMDTRLFLVVTVLCAGGLIASGSYAGMFGLIVGLMLFELFDNRGRIAMIALIAIVAISAIPLQENIAIRLAYQYREGGLVPQTLAFRFYVWRDIFLPIIRETWLWGYHPVMPTTLPWQYPESQYFELLLRSGIISLLAHLAWVSLTLVWLFRNFRTGTGLYRSLSAIVFLLFLILSIMGLTNGVFVYSGVIEYVWILLGLIGVMGERR